MYDLGDEGIFLIIRGVGFDLGENERVTVLDYTLGEAGDWERTYLNRGFAVREGVVINLQPRCKGKSS